MRFKKCLGQKKRYSACKELSANRFLYIWNTVTRFGYMICSLQQATK